MKDDQNLYTVKALLGPLLEMREEVLFRMSPSHYFSEVNVLQVV